MQPPLVDGHDLLGRDQVDVVRPKGHALLGLMHDHLGVARQQLHHERLVVRGKVLHDDQRHAGIGRHGIEKPL